MDFSKQPRCKKHNQPPGRLQANRNEVEQRLHLDNNGSKSDWPRKQYFTIPLAALVMVIKNA